MRIAFVTIEPPSLRKGASVRNYNLIKQAASRGAIVDVLTLSQPGENLQYLKEELGIRELIVLPQGKMTPLGHMLVAILKRIPPYFAEYRISGLSDAVLDYAKRWKPDIIQLEELHAYDAIAPAIPELKESGIKMVLDAHNVEHRLFANSIKSFSTLKYLIGLYIAPQMRKIELEAAKTADHIFTCSENDRAFFSQTTGENKVALAPNGVDCMLFTPQPLVREHSIVFAGSMDYPPNDEALRFYFQKVHPLVKERISDAKITLLGGEPAQWLKEMAREDSSIITPGFVPDVRSYIRNSRICISPMHSGSGTSLKILEYMGSGKPIVSTSIGVRGIMCRNGEEALIADNAQDFADAVISLMTDDLLAIKLGNGARRTAEIVYDWKNSGETMSQVFETLSRKNL